MHPFHAWKKKTKKQKNQQLYSLNIEPQETISAFSTKTNESSPKCSNAYLTKIIDHTKLKPTLTS